MRRSGNPELGSYPIDALTRLRGLAALGAAVTRSQHVLMETPVPYPQRTQFVAGEPHIAVREAYTPVIAVSDITETTVISEDTTVTAEPTGPTGVGVTAPNVVFLSPTDARIPVGPVAGTYRSAML